MMRRMSDKDEAGDGEVECDEDGKQRRKQVDRWRIIWSGLSRVG